MTDPKREEREGQEPEAEDAAPFELEADEAAGPEAVAEALAAHQMEAIEEVESAFFGLEEGEEAEADAPGEESGAGAETPLIVDLAEAKEIVETLLFVSHDPLRPRDISMVFRGVENVNAKVVRKILAELKEEYADRTLQIVEVAEGFRLCTRPDFSFWVRRFLKQDRRPRISQAGVETLAILAYKQPVTRAEIEEIRRVDCSGVLNTLLEKLMVRILGRRDVVGRPIVYGTTPQFLEHFGFKSLSDMPKPDELDLETHMGPGAEDDILPIDDEEALPAAAVEPAAAAAESAGEEEESLLAGETNGGGAIPEGETNGSANGHASLPEAAEAAEVEEENT
ncbi:MAG: SMC-Scp complex subunit ScpB [bacterium]